MDGITVNTGVLAPGSGPGYCAGMSTPEPLSLHHLEHPALTSDQEFAGLLRAPALADLHRARERTRLASAMDAGSWGLACEAGVTLVRPLDWDTEHFGHRCADLTRIYRAEDPEGPPGRDFLGLLEATIQRCRELGVTLLSGRLPAAWVSTLGALTDLGARLVDTSVELGRPLPLRRPPGVPELVVRRARPEDEEALVEIAHGFTRNRFFRDARIPEGKAHGVYTSWVKNAMTDGHGSLALAEVDGQVAGLATHLVTDAALEVGLVALVAVHPRFRGRRVVDALMQGCERLLGGEVLVTSTQVSNGAALRGFGRHGLLPFNARHIFHLWLD